MRRTAIVPRGGELAGVRSGWPPGRRVARATNRIFRDLSVPFYGANRAGATASDGLEDSFWLQGMLAGYPAAYECIEAFSETNFTDDLRKFDVPTLILHGDDDRIVPYADSAPLTAKIVPHAVLTTYEGAPHGSCSTLEDRVNADLPAFVAAPVPASASR